MRTIIISDITETSESIIPYGLNVGKHTETRVEILHYGDPRQVQGKYSPIADSQSITPAEKLSHEQVLHREKEITRNLLDKLLSKEASKLNYPLRINTITENGYAEQTIAEQIEKYDNPLVITGTTPGRSMVSGLHDLLDIVLTTDAKILIVPPAKKFVKPDTCCLVTDLSSEVNGKIDMLFHWLNPLVSKIYTSALVHTSFHNRDNQQMEEWNKALAPHHDKINSNSTEVFYIEEVSIAFENICKQKSPDMVALPKNKNSYFAQYLFAGNKVKELTEQIKIPVLLY